MKNETLSELYVGLLEYQKNTVVTVRVEMINLGNVQNHVI
ncbi:hypothetical protein QFZ80_006809 [Paenibacillus sp. V4I7]|nr:hypothetical protein [Paenibacillus sp. V4I7]MDQ0918543.1 hypothetical protein [Paenibacillus sp. V4I5]